MAARKNKTSKTEHVLNLLTGSGAATPGTSPQPQVAPPAAEAAPEPQAAPSVSRETDRRRSAPILEVARANNEALSETIHNGLEQALEEELAGLSPAEPEPMAAAAPVADQNLPVRPQNIPDPAPEPEVLEAVPAPEISEQAPEEEHSGPAAEPEPEELEAAQNLESSEPVPPSPEPAASDSSAPKEVPAPDQTEAEGAVLPDGTVCVNVMWELVEEKAERYIRMFGLCTCPRCVADVKALALTNLPAKYVVLKETARKPMVSLYRARFDAPVTAQLLSACKQVMDAPRHEDGFKDGV